MLFLVVAPFTRLSYWGCATNDPFEVCWTRLFRKCPPSVAARSSVLRVCLLRVLCLEIWLLPEGLGLNLVKCGMLLRSAGAVIKAIKGSKRWWSPPTYCCPDKRGLFYSCSLNQAFIFSPLWFGGTPLPLRVCGRPE